jgi:hypothetical protein
MLPKRLKQLEKQNTKLKRLVVELLLEKQILKDVAEGSPERRRGAVEHPRSAVSYRISYVSQHPILVHSTRYTLPGNLIDERLSVSRPSVGLRHS